MHEYKDSVRVCRNVMKKTRAHLELNLAVCVKDNKKDFFEYINIKAKPWKMRACYRMG